MKLSYEEKIEMYRKWKNREKSPGQLAVEYGVAYSSIEYMVKSVWYMGVFCVGENKVQRNESDCSSIFLFIKNNR